MNKIKVRLTVIALVAIVVTLLVQGTLAYYSTEKTATNVVTSGSIKFIIHETNISQDGINILPGDVISKQVNIQSDCEHPFYLRVKVVYSVDSDELSSENCFKLDIDQSIWVLHDGWYYYTETVSPHEYTADLFTKIEIVGSEMDNEYLGKSLKLKVVAQAVQSENNPITDGNTYTASGWPQE